MNPEEGNFFGVLFFAAPPAPAGEGSGSTVGSLAFILPKMKHGEEHITFLDHVRGAAILLVILYHSVFVSFWHSHQAVQLNWNGWLRDPHGSNSLLAVLPATLGWTGVAIFFVVSGFCIHLSHERSRLKSFKVFFLRRFFRIYPPYLLAMLACAAVYPLAHADFRGLTGQVVSHILLLYNFDEVYHSGINASLWSIAVEVQLYALYPLLLGLASRVGWYRALWVTALVEMGIRILKVGVLIYSPSVDPEFKFYWWYTDSPFAFWFSWSIGAALAEAHLKGRPLPFKNVPLLLYPALFLICYWVRPLYPFCFTLAALSTVCVIASLLNRPGLRIPSNGWPGFSLTQLRWTGIVSYSAYLYHGPILSQIPAVAAVIFRTHDLPPLFLFGLCLLSCPFVFGLAYLSYRYIELPSIALGKRIVQNLRVTDAVSVPAPN
jgi:peptidoglycan/LPS O-acetylase OafA/YrhL